VSAGLDVDTYLGWRFHLAHANCWHMVRAAWLDLTGRDLGDRTPERITTAALLSRFETGPADLDEQPRAVDPSIVLMANPGTVPHVGVFTRGRVLQVTRDGASFLPLVTATAGFKSVRFFQ
jgi:hypothetical protein